MSRIHRLIPSVLAIVLATATGCAPETPTSPPSDTTVQSVILNNPIFPATTVISNLAPKLGENPSDAPTFVWPQTRRKLVIVVLFGRDRTIDTDGEGIANTEDIIWVWHSKMGKASEGYVPYGSGMPVSGGTIQYGLTPRPLDPGLYYWAVWAWDDMGKKIDLSSPPMYFVIPG